MSKTSTADPMEGQAAEPVSGLVVPSTKALAIPTEAELDQILGSRQIPVKQWIAALVAEEQFEETDQEDRALGMIRSILLAESSEAVFAAMNVVSVKDLIGPDPGAQSNVFEIHGAQPLKSSYDEGPSAFALIHAYDLAEQVPVTLSTGARSVQAAVIAHMIRGWMPFKARFTRKKRPTEAGYYPLNLERGI